MTLALLFALYFVQGLPFGFQVVALPILLREGGASLAALGFLSLLSIPWLAKPLWAPLVDGYGASRRAWILPLQGGLALTIAAAGLVDTSSTTGITTLLALVFFMNLFAATQDIAVDGLAVDLLGQRQLGPGNAAQVVGYKLGMLVGGGVFVALSAFLPWRTLMFAMAGLVVAVLLVAATMPVARAARRAPVRLRAVVVELFQALSGSRALLVFLVTYKLGESVSSGVWKLFLLDIGHGKGFIGLLSGVGMWASIVGSLGGALLATRLPMVTALWIPAVARLVPLAAQALIALSPPAASVIMVVSIFEHMAGGALTTVVFALMMSRVDARIGASHYTALAAVEVAGKYPGFWLSGIFAQFLGYPAVFALATALTALVLLAIPPLRAAKMPGPVVASTT